MYDIHCARRGGQRRQVAQTPAIAGGCGRGTGHAVAGVRLARGEPVRALDTGGDVVLKADSVCVHGDKPSAVAQAKAVRDALVAAGFELVGLPEVVA